MSHLNNTRDARALKIAQTRKSPTTSCRRCFVFKFFLIAFSILCSITTHTIPLADKTAKSLFSGLQEIVYQIRVIDIASGDKYSIGSGFQITSDGHIASNFHVVSSFVHKPEKYRLEVEKYNGTKQVVKLLAIDVVHDLAIVKLDITQSDDAKPDDGKPKFLPINTTNLSQGDRIYSMGNPQDLGMTIIEGTYNGLLKNSRYPKILFSGSLNSGMSGGPSLNSQGEVIGINVSKGDEQISFLVPAAHLSVLLEDVLSESTLNESALSKDSHKDFIYEITSALLDDQQSFYRSLLSNPLDLKPLGKLHLPGKLIESLKCWGHTVEKDDIKYEAVHQHCRLQDEIYVSNDLSVGNFFYDYEWITTTELNRLQFYTLLERRFKHANLRNTYDEEQINEYQCQTDRVQLPSGTWKVSSCLRSYKVHEGIYDAVLVMALVDYKAQAAIVKTGASGISKDNALTFFRHMMEAIEWTP